MAVIRVEKTTNYTVMSNDHLRDRRLSLKAKGLMSQMLSLPDDWDYSISGLVAINEESESAIKAALKELKNAGYLVIKKIYPNQTISGRFEYEYILYERPQEEEKQEVEKQEVENQPVEILPVENHTLNKYKDKQNTEIVNKEKKRFIPPTIDEIRGYCFEIGASVNPEQFHDYYTANGWLVGKAHMKDWKATIRNWQRRERGNTGNMNPRAENPFTELKRLEKMA